MGNSLPSLRRADEFDAGADLLRQRFRRGSGAVGDQPFRKAFGNDVLDLLPDQFVAAVAELLLRLHVQQDDLSALVYHHHGVGRRFEQAAILRSRLLALAEIAADLRKSPQISGGIAQRRVGHTLEKSGAVFAHAHALFFMAATAGRYPKQFLRPASLDIFRREEAGKVVTDNLFGGVAFHALGSGVPADHLALGVQHEDGVVLHSVEQHPVFLFAVPQSFLCPPPFGGAAQQAPARQGSDQ